METLPPPNWIQWAAVISVIIAGLGLILNSVVFFVERWSKNKDIDRSKIDEYWLRTILFPVCIQPLITLAIDTTRTVTALHNSDQPIGEIEIRKTLSDFTQQKVAIINSSILLTIIGETAYHSFSSKLDDLEDEFVHFFAPPEAEGAKPNKSAMIRSDLTYMQQYIWVRTKNIIEELIELHRKA